MDGVRLAAIALGMLLLVSFIPAFGQSGFAVKTDKLSYRTGETVSISGDVGTVSGQQLQIEIFNSENQLYLSDRIPVSPDGSFRHSFAIQGPLGIPGPYGVVASYGETFSQIQFGVEAGVISVATDRRLYAPGQVVTVNGTAGSAGEVSIAVTGPGGDELVRDQAQVKDGSFTYLLAAGKLADMGNYRIVASSEGLSAETQFTVAAPGAGLKIIAVGSVQSPYVVAKVTNTSDKSLYGVYFRLPPGSEVSMARAPSGWSTEVDESGAGFTATSPLEPGKTIALRIWAAPTVQNIDWSGHGLDGDALTGTAKVGVRGLRS
ncbi:MAG: hypothetical protein ACREAY_05490 [Nitrososphaera sp.]|uniref:hypothetical protein n=1 Tax=Nitrososphaera sp. TaxID=1971748 RepID=UPI003D6DFED7